MLAYDKFQYAMWHGGKLGITGGIVCWFEVNKLSTWYLMYQLYVYSSYVFFFRMVSCFVCFEHIGNISCGFLPCMIFSYRKKIEVVIDQLTKSLVIEIVRRPFCTSVLKSFDEIKYHVLSYQQFYASSLRSKYCESQRDSERVFFVLPNKWWNSHWVVRFLALKFPCKLVLPLGKRVELSSTQSEASPNTFVSSVDFEQQKSKLRF